MLINLFIIVIGFAITLWGSNWLMDYLMKDQKDLNKDNKVDESDDKIRREGFIIGKCENIIILCCVLNDAYTGLALIFTAKSLVRGEDMRKNSRYFFVGTVVNFTFSLVIGILMRLALDYTIEGFAYK